MTLLYIQQYGNVFEVRLRSDEAVNAWQGVLILPDNLSALDLAYGRSIGSIWQTPPSYADGLVEFAGGTPAGFTGDGLLFAFTAETAPGSGSRSGQLISFDLGRTSLYAADGQGTRLPAFLQPLTVNVADLAVAGESSRPARDTEPPGEFEIMVIQDPAIFSGRKAIVFYAADADSGIDRYEVEERTVAGTIGWHVAESPYLIDPDTLSLSVRAIDRAGNARVEDISFPPPGPSGREVLFILAVALAALAAAYLLDKWRKRRSS